MRTLFAPLHLVFTNYHPLEYLELMEYLSHFTSLVDSFEMC
jgi:hypothetical protein